MKIYNWGIVGAGRIACSFAKGLQAANNAKLYAIASRELSRAEAFAAEYHVPHAYGSYQELAADANIDIVYVAVINHVHFDVVIQMLKAGKAVICEKPMMLNAMDIKIAADYALRHQRFLMEAMWWKFLPVYRTISKWVDEQRIGDIRIIKSDFGYGKSYQGDERQLYPELGGGALYDVGIYNIALANMFLGEICGISGHARKNRKGVDMASTVSLCASNGGLAVSTCSIDTPTPWDAWLIGSKGTIHIQDFWRSTKATLMIQGHDDVVASAPFLANGYEFEAIHVMECLDLGKTESPIMPLNDSIIIAETIDELLRQYDYGK